MGEAEAPPVAHALHRLLSAVGSVANTEAVAGAAEAQPPGGRVAPAGRVSAGSLAGVSVVNARGEELGRIADLLIELEHGCVVEAIVAVGGILGIGGRAVGVAWHTLEYDAARGRLQLDTEARALPDPSLPATR